MNNINDIDIIVFDIMVSKRYNECYADECVARADLNGDCFIVDYFDVNFHEFKDGELLYLSTLILNKLKESHIVASSESVTGGVFYDGVFKYYEFQIAFCVKKLLS